MALCSGLAAAIFLVGSLLPYVLFRQYLLRPETAILGFGLLPLGFAWALLRYRFLGMSLGPWAMLRTVFDAIADPIFVVGPDGYLVEASRSGLELLGIKRTKDAVEPFQEMIGSLEVGNADGASLGRTMVQKVLGGGRVSSEEKSLRGAQDEILHVSVSGTPVVDEGGQVDLGVLVYRDITQRRQMEEALRKAHDELEVRIQERTTELVRANERLGTMLEETIQAMALMVEMRDPYTAGHQRRVAALASAIAREMGLKGDQVRAISLAATVHDVGKISVPVEILSKPGRLNDNEFNMIKAHSQVGYDIVKAIEFPWPIADTIVQHHERLNGSGYPSGLKGEGIILEARIVALADVVEAMAFDRPYRPAIGIDEALDEIGQNRGILYDPDVVDACLKVLKDLAFDFGRL